MLPLLALSLLTCDAPPLLIKNVAVFDGKRIQGARDVLIENGRIAKIGRVQRNVRSIDGTGHTLLPGLIDPHLHFSIPGLPSGMNAEAISGRQLLRSGVTSGRLHLASLEKAKSLKQQGEDPCGVVPSLVAGGPGIAGGAPQLNGAQYGGVKDAADARAKVRRIAEAGLDWAPLHDVEKFSEAERDAIQAEARACQIKLFIAATTPGQVRLGLAMKAHSIDYVDRTTAPGYPADVLAAWRKAKVPAVPTLGIFARYAACREGRACPTGEEGGFTSPEAKTAIAAEVQKDLRSNAYVRESEAFWPTLPQKLRELRATGAPVLVATDVGSPAYLHEGAIWWEMETWKRFGVAPIEVLRAVTSLSAAAMGWKDRGILRQGARADFVLYEGDPTQGDFELGRVIAVGRQGRLVVESKRWVGP